MIGDFLMKNLRLILELSFSLTVINIHRHLQLFLIVLKETTQFILNLITYMDSIWKVNTHFKVPAMLLELKGNFTKYCCFLCLYDSISTNKHCFVNAPKTEFISGKSNIKYLLLIYHQNAILPPLHTKLCVM